MYSNVQGFKGILVVDGEFCGQKIRFRKSMEKIKKFQLENWTKLGVVEYSKPDCYGYLNTQLVVLLSALGVSNEIFIAKHQENLECILGLTCDVVKALKYLILRNELELAGGYFL